MNAWMLCGIHSIRNCCTSLNYQELQIFPEHPSTSGALTRLLNQSRLWFSHLEKQSQTCCAQGVTLRKPLPEPELSPAFPAALTNRAGLFAAPWPRPVTHTQLLSSTLKCLQKLCFRAGGNQFCSVTSASCGLMEGWYWKRYELPLPIFLVAPGKTGNSSRGCRGDRDMKDYQLLTHSPGRQQMKAKAKLEFLSRYWIFHPFFSCHPGYLIFLPRIHVSQGEFSFQPPTTNKRRVEHLLWYFKHKRRKTCSFVLPMLVNTLCLPLFPEGYTTLVQNGNVLTGTERQLWLLHWFFPRYKYRSSPIIATQSRSACGDKEGEKKK